MGSRHRRSTPPPQARPRSPGAGAGLAEARRWLPPPRPEGTLRPRGAVPVAVSAGPGLAGEAAEAEERVQLDRVWRDAGLAVVVVEEGDAGHAGPRAEPDAAAGGAHSAALGRRRPRVA